MAIGPNYSDDVLDIIGHQCDAKWLVNDGDRPPYVETNFENIDKVELSGKVLIGTMAPKRLVYYLDLSDHVGVLFCDYRTIRSLFVPEFWKDVKEDYKRHREWVATRPEYFDLEKYRQIDKLVSGQGSADTRH